MMYKRTEENLFLVNLNFPERARYLKGLLQDYEKIKKEKANNEITEEDFLKIEKIINRQRKFIVAMCYEDIRINSGRLR